MKTKNILNYIIIFLLIFEILLSLYLITKDLNKKQDQNICIIGKGCDIVQQSVYGQVFGIKLPFLAIFAFIILLILYFYNKKIFYFGIFLGTLFSLYLITVQLFILKHICSNCMIVDIIMILIFIFYRIEILFKKT